MITRPLIVGAKGSMGRRYTAILRSFGIKPLLMDLGDDVPKGFDGVIIATPTALHLEHIERFIRYGKPILCEKPFATTMKEVERVLALVDTAPVKVDMVNQYKYLPLTRSARGGITIYDYYNHGRDGLVWDCISVLALAENEVALAEESAIWTCKINGQDIKLSDMDWAYIDMMKAWLNGTLEGHGYDYIRDSHAKALAYVEATN